MWRVEGKVEGLMEGFRIHSSSINWKGGGFGGFGVFF